MWQIVGKLSNLSVKRLKTALNRILLSMVRPPQYRKESNHG